MERKKALELSSPIMKPKYQIHGSQVIIRGEDLDPGYPSRINYIVDCNCFRKRRTRSQELRNNHKEQDTNLLKNVIIEIKNTEENKQRNVTLPTPRSRSKWTVLRSVLRAIALFRTSEAETINNEEDLDHALENYRTRRARANSAVHYKENEFDRHFADERFYELIAKGLPEDVHELDTILHNDRRMYLYAPTDSASLVNAKNSMGLTPLYVATQNGNLGMVKYLISKGANPLINSQASSKEEVSNLLVAARWKHAKIVEFYLKSYDWSYDELKNVKNVAGNELIKHKISKRMKVKEPKSSWFCCRPAKKTKK